MEGDEKADAGSGSGMTGGRKAPRWTIAFLRALQRAGEVEAAARDAGIDKTTAYYRRRRYPDFAQAWEGALAAHTAAHSAAAAGSLDTLGTNGKGHDGAAPASIGTLGANGPGDVSPHGSRQTELLASSALCGQVRRSGPGRWTEAAEGRFFDALAATANVGRAAAAAGVSKNAVYARRMKRPGFRAKWDAVLATGRAAIEMHLVESARKSFDPDALELGEDSAPNVSVAEAIRIVQLHGSRAQQQSIEDEAEVHERDVKAARARIVRRLERMRGAMKAQRLSEGWSFDESYDALIPPGYVRGPGYQPFVPEPEGRDFWEQIRAEEEGSALANGDDVPYPCADGR